MASPIPINLKARAMQCSLMADDCYQLTLNLAAARSDNMGMSRSPGALLTDPLKKIA